jgi:hypothetical protein
MTRKDYVELAKIMANLKEYIEPRTREGRGFDEAVSQLIDWLSEENPRFDAARFESAIYDSRS